MKLFRRNVVSRLVLAAVFAALLALVSGAVLAQESEGEEQETRQVSGINAKVYEKFAEAQELAEADNYQGAHAGRVDGFAVDDARLVFPFLHRLD